MMNQPPTAEPVTTRKFVSASNRIDGIGTALRDAYPTDPAGDAELFALLEKLDPAAISDRD